MSPRILLLFSFNRANVHLDYDCVSIRKEKRKRKKLENRNKRLITRDKIRNKIKVNVFLYFRKFHESQRRNIRREMDGNVNCYLIIYLIIYSTVILE